MTRLTLRKGFTLQVAPGGVGHLTDTRTGDALVVPLAEFEVLSAAGKEFDGDQPELAAVLVRYRPFYVEAIDEAAPASFYELDIGDAPTLPQFPSIAPVTLQQPAVALEPETKEHVAVEAPPAEGEFTQPAGVGATLLPPPVEPVTREENVPPAHEPQRTAEFTREESVPQAHAQPHAEEVARQENIRQAHEPQHTEEVSAADVAAAIGGASSRGAPSAAPEMAARPPRSRRRPLALAFTGVTLLAIAVAATFALRPKSEPNLPEVPTATTVVTTTVVDAGVPETIDAGAPEAGLDAGAVMPLVPEPIIDAGAPVAVMEEDAGTAEASQWVSADVQARGRVKMGEVTAGAEGEVSWTVADEERVKAKQAIGSVAREGGEPVPVTASSVGLVMLKAPAGTKAKRGAVLAEIIYFEAWARGVVKSAAPKMGWRCEVSSAALQQTAECKLSVVAPRGNGAVVTVAIEPRWFDGATDAVLRFAPSP